MNQRISGLIDTMTIAEEASLSDRDTAEAMAIRTARSILEDYALNEARREKRLQTLIDRAEAELIISGDTRRQKRVTS